MSAIAHVDAILSFWFGDTDEERQAAPRRWFTVDPAFDATIRDRFGATLDAAARGDLDDWVYGESASAKSLLAFVVVLDQFSRNVHRGTPRAFENDARALAATEHAIATGLDQRLGPVERSVLYLPRMHSEDVEEQESSVVVFEGLAREFPTGPLGAMLANAADYARRHEDIVRRFGRFPHRNAVLGRASTDEERRFLDQPGSSF